MDIKCVVCGEPWDAYGVKHGDMLPWEADLFRQGAGCPCCRGQEPDLEWHPETIEDVENGDEDPMERINAYANRDKRPAWKRPEDPLHWTCAACGVQAVTDLDSGEVVYNLPLDAKGQQWFSSHPYGRGEPEKEPAHIFAKGSPEPRPVCEFCLQHCEDCGAPISGLLDFADVYDEGASFPHPDSYDEVLCVECLGLHDNSEEG